MPLPYSSPEWSGPPQYLIDEQTQAVDVRIDLRYFQLQLLTDHLDYQKASHFGAALSLSLVL
ncbi:hypothetical protein [Ferrimonas pelagia]|uniref:Uncharacterized protein n=1 Tax=Ferrimonas pelagia TaxID=1177826 RepID=A0ABP9EAZ2_9GAMM